MAIDISGLAYFMPIFSFIFIFAIVYALLNKSKILGENKPVILLISFFIAIVFATTENTRTYIETVTPWIVVLFVSLLFILIMISLSQRKFEDFIQPGFVWFFIIAIFVIFLVSANQVFSHYMLFQNLRTTLTQNERLTGGLLLIAVGWFATWTLVRKYN